jgi:glycosyltransferase domain-containing protein
MVIPTYNRPTLLAHTLRYLENIKFKFPLAICDTTPQSLRDANKAIIEGLSGKLQLEYVWYDFAAFPHRNFAVARSVVQALESFDDEYAVLCADDDYHVFPMVEFCMEFLDAHPDFVTAHGRLLHVATFDPELADPVGMPTSALWGFVRQPKTCASDDPVMRLREILNSDGGTYYSVHRREILIHNMETTRSVTYGWFLDPLTSFLDAIEGKSYSGNAIYSVRPYHAYPPNEYEPSFRLDISQIANQPDYALAQSSFCDAIALELHERSQIPLDKASQITGALLDPWFNECAHGSMALSQRTPFGVHSIPTLIRNAVRLASNGKFATKPRSVWRAAHFVTKYRYTPLDAPTRDQAKSVFDNWASTVWQHSLPKVLPPTIKKM